jgi:hypothetical protein
MTIAGGLLIHPDLFAQTDFQLFVSVHKPLSCTTGAHLQFMVQQVFGKNPWGSSLDSTSKPRLIARNMR